MRSGPISAPQIKRKDSLTALDREDNPPAVEIQLPSPSVPPWAENLAWLLDDAIRLPGTRFRVGLDAILGLIFPSAGDLLTTLAGLSLLLLGVKLRMPLPVLTRMVGNIALDLIVGMIPGLGDLGDVIVRSNRKNLELLRATREGKRRSLQPHEYGILVALGALLLVVACATAAITWLFYSWLLG